MLNSRIRNQEKKQCILYSILKELKLLVRTFFFAFAFVFVCKPPIYLVLNCHYSKGNKSNNNNKKNVFHFPIHCKP